MLQESGHGFLQLLHLPGVGHLNLGGCLGDERGCVDLGRLRNAKFIGMRSSQTNPCAFELVIRERAIFLLFGSLGSL